jgi:hypothetical protein
MPTDQNEREYEQPPALTPEDEEILDQIWDKIGREERRPEQNPFPCTAGAGRERITKFVRVYKLDSRGNDVFVGVIFIRDGKIDYSPRDSPTLAYMAEDTVRRFPHATTGEQGVDASEPDVFLESIHHQFQSPYLRVGRVKDGVPSDWTG